MSEHHATGHADGPTPSAGHGHDDPMSHVPPGSIWPLITTIGLTILPFGVLGVLDTIPHLISKGAGLGLLGLGTLIFLVGLMAWCSQIIREKQISHDLGAQQRDLQLFTLLFLCGETAAFGAVFGFFYHQKMLHGAHFGPPHIEGFHFGGALPAYATFILLSSSVTCEFAHIALQRHQIGMARAMFAITIILGIIFLGFMGYEWGEFIQRGFYPMALVGQNPDLGPAAAFAAVFYVGTGFHGLHVAIGLVMLFLVLFRLEVGHFRGKRHFAAVAASWYWHFVDIIWVLLFITVYVVA